MVQVTASKSVTLWNRGLTSYDVGKVAGILIQKKRIFYFSRSTPADLRYRFNKRKIEVSFRTKSEAKTYRSAEALSERLAVTMKYRFI